MSTMVMNVKRRSICPSMFIFFNIMYIKDISALNVVAVAQSTTQLRLYVREILVDKRYTLVNAVL